VISDLKIFAGDVELTSLFDLSAEPVGRFDKRRINTLLEGRKIGAQRVGSNVDVKTITLHFYSDRDNYHAINTMLAKLFLAEEKFPLRFSDMPNCYWNVVVDGDYTIARDSNNTRICAGTISFLAEDGVYYSVGTSDFPNGSYTLDENADGSLQMKVNNNGTAPVYPTFEFTHEADNGYIQVVSPSGAMELGKRTEVDSEGYQQSELLINRTTFNGATENAGVLTESRITQNGSLSQSIRDGQNCLQLSSRGSGSYWHGGSYTFTIPADSNQEVGAKNFWCYWNWVFWALTMGETGLMEIIISDENDQLIMGMGAYKDDATGNTGHCKFWVGGNHPREWKDIAFETNHLDSDNPFNQPRGHSDMIKEGAELQYYWFGSRFHLNVPELANRVARKVTLFIGNYGGQTRDVGYMAFRALQFQKNHVEKMRNVPNRYREGTVVTVDGDSGDIYVDYSKQLTELVQGSQLIELPPGESLLRFYFSEWCQEHPQIAVRFKERWL
jgi:hypothetical protein